MKNHNQPPFIWLYICMIMLSSCAVRNSQGADRLITREEAITDIIERIKLSEIGPGQINIADFGAIGDGQFDCKPAIDEAMQKMSGAGGGKIIVPKGTWFCGGPIHFESKINLHLEEGATLLFSQNPQDYLPLQLVRWEGTELYNYSPYLFANGKTDIAITGKGKLNGNAIGGIAEWRSKQKPDQSLLRKMGKDQVPVEKRMFGENHFLRMSFIQLMNCSNILIQGVTIENVPFWVIHPTYCKNITIRDVHVNSTRINNDGIDLDSSEDALVEDCTFNAGDDAIAIKSGRDQDAWRINKPSRNIVIRNCLAREVLHGMAFGSEMSGGVENVYVDNFFMKRVKQYAFQFKANKDRGGFIRNVSVDGAFIDSTRTAIFFTNDYHGYQGGESPSDFHNITIKNLVCNHATGRGIDIKGLDENPIHHVVLENVLVLKEREPSVHSNMEESTFENVEVNGKEVVFKNR